LKKVAHASPSHYRRAQSTAEPTHTSVGRTPSDIGRPLTRPYVRGTTSPASVHRKTSSAIHSRPPLPVHPTTTKSPYHTHATRSETTTRLQRHAERWQRCWQTRPRESSSRGRCGLRSSLRGCGASGAEAAAITGDDSPILCGSATTAKIQKGPRAATCDRPGLVSQDKSDTETGTTAPRWAACKTSLPVYIRVGDGVWRAGNLLCPGFRRSGRCTGAIAATTGSLEASIGR
jgi:hypothetical protein